jgi:transcriptional regulator with XRE-family HTH domain
MPGQLECQALRCTLTPTSSCGLVLAIATYYKVGSDAPHMTTFGELLDHWLNERQMSQSELGRRLGLKSAGAAVNQWVKNRSGISRDHAVQIEDELDVQPRGSLIEAAGYSVTDPGGPTPESLLRADPGIDAEDKRVLLRVLRMARERFRPSPEPATASYDVDLDDPGERTIWEMDVLPEEERWQHILRLRRHLGDERGREAS